MPPLPSLNGRAVVKIFAKVGWQKVPQRGAHMILVKPGHMASLSVPDHKEDRQRNVAKLDTGQWLNRG